MAGKKIYFASDFHLGVPDTKSSLEREKRLVSWLDQVKADAAEIYLMGDLFDFWFEYKHAIPKGFTRVLGKLAELCDAHIPIYLFTGNHDMWMFDYLPNEIGVKIYREPITKEWDGKKFYLGHGDGLGPGDNSYKLLKKTFANPLCQWLFARLHPNLGIGIARYWSKKSRIANSAKDEKYHGDDKELLVLYSKEVLKTQKIDFFIFGHRHLPLDIKVGENARYINLGEWVNYNSYAVWDGEKLELKYYK